MTAPPSPFDDASQVEAVTGRMLRHSHDYAVVVLTKEGTIQGWHGASERLFGHTAQEVVGRGFGLLFTPQDVERGMDQQELAVALATGRSEDDRWHLRRDGQQFWGSGVLTALHDDDGQVSGLCKLLRDRTDQRAQVEALEHRVATRDAEIQRRKAFFASTVHELRNPLGPIAASLELLKRELPQPMRERTLNVVDKQLRLMTTLIEDLAQAVHLETTQLRLSLQSVDLGEALNVLVDNHQPQALAAGVNLRLLLPEMPILVQADPQRLQQMLLNLVSNSLKYTRRGGRVNVSATVEADMGVMRIDDDGIGIAPEVLPTIFELFTREGRDDEQVQGLGIGLAVVQQLAELHGGNVEVRSPGAGKGSSFALRLPLANDDPSPRP